MIGRFHTISEWQPSPFRKVWSSWRTGRPQLMASLARQQERFGIPFGMVGRGSSHRKWLRPPEVWRRSRAISPWPPPDGECTSGLFNSHLRINVSLEHVSTYAFYDCETVEREILQKLTLWVVTVFGSMPHGTINHRLGRRWQSQIPSDWLYIVVTVMQMGYLSFLNHLSYHITSYHMRRLFFKCT